MTGNTMLYVKAHSVKMKYTLLFLLLVTVVAFSYEQEEPKNPPDAEFYKNLQPLKRFVRQMPPPPEMPPPPQMPKFEHSVSDSYFENRQKREAKGVGGALPTRKG
ncbi:uncharacterized protein LOC116768041 [Danaus plexippus]|nr:uncharacterized protein LOC116768041 [Danaus plexippus]